MSDIFLTIDLHFFSHIKGRGIYMNIPLFQLENHGVKHSVAYKIAYHKTYYHIVCFTGKVAFVLSSL